MRPGASWQMQATEIAKSARQELPAKTTPEAIEIHQTITPALETAFSSTISESES